MPTAPPPGTDSSGRAPGGGSSSAPAVMIIGASARAAAFSAIRAGFQTTCVDQFADVDLQQFSDTVRVKNYPTGVVSQVEQLPEMPVLYSGAMENHPKVLRAIAAKRQLLGNDWQTVEAVRDPRQVHDALTKVKVPCLNIRANSKPPPPDGSWMLKPLHGAGGRGIAVWDENAAASPTLREPHYFQKRSHGEAISAVFVAHQDPFSIRYVGLTRQLIGLPELNAPSFGWCGSLGPIALDVGGEILVRRTGSVLAHQFGLRGLFGCDFMLEAPDRPLLVEVNPRYTASVELLEILCGFNLMREHCAATGMALPEEMEENVLTAPSGATVGKVVVFAGQDSVAPDTSSWVRMTPVGPVPALADVPEEGTLLPQGTPVCTLLAAAKTEDECRRYLLRRAAEVTRWL